MQEYIKDKLVFDIGANSGDKTGHFLSLGASKVVAVEPCTDVFTDLKYKFDKNNQVILENVAISDKAGLTTLYLAGGRTTNTISDAFMQRTGQKRFPAGSWREKITVKTTTLNDLIAKYGIPNFCKIDVEGAELQVIRGLSSPINFVSFEFTAEFMEESFECMDLLSALDNRYKFNISINDAQPAFPDFVDIDLIKEYITRTFTNDFYNFGMINAIIL